MRLSQAGEVLREFAEHLAADVKQLTADEETAQKSYRYVRTGTNHYSLAFTYDTIAWSRHGWIDLSRYGRLGERDERWRTNMSTMRF